MLSIDAFKSSVFEKNFHILTNSPVEDLDQRVEHEHKEQWREVISPDYAIREADFINLFPGPFGQTDPPSRHHFNNEHPDADGEAVHFEELLQEGVIDLIVRILEVVVELHNSILILPQNLRTNGSIIL